MKTLSFDLKTSGGVGVGIGAGGLKPPAGYVFLVDYDGTYLTDENGYFLIEAI